MNAIVNRGPGYQRLAAWKVENPSDQRFIPGRTVMVLPAGEEAPGWRAILAGTDGTDTYVVPLAGHFGELRLRKVRGTGRFCLSLDEPFAGGRYAEGDECDWLAAKCLALSTAYAFTLTGIDR
jgi:hypothetical protein